MNFTPKTDEQINSDGLLPKGVYDFTIISSEDYVGKSSGKESIKIKLNVFGNDGKDYHVYDYLTPNFAKKFKHACVGLGMADKYEFGSIMASDFQGRSGKVEIDIEPSKGDYPARNKVVDFIVDKSFKAPEGLGATKTADGDEIPF